MDELIVALLTWISVETGFAMPPLPPVAFVSKEEISQVAYGRPWRESDSVMAVYRRDASTVYLRADWRVGDLRSRATLLHELVHHVQAFNDARFDCRNRQQFQAYDLALRWLQQQGAEDPYLVLGVDELLIFILSSCRD